MREMKDSGIEWIGEIPQDWYVVPIRSAFLEVKNKNIDGKITNALQFKYGTIIRKNNFNTDDDYVADTILNYNIVEPNTIMINCLNLNYDFISFRVAIVKETGIITSAYLAIKPDEQTIYPMYANYLFKAYDNCKAFHNMGIGVRKTLSFNELKGEKMLLPSMKKQTEIVSEIDSKCYKIDTVIKKIKETIDEYKKLKQSVIIEAVTKGIRADREMKDSGVEWIGEIPREWGITALKYLCNMQAGKTLSSEQISDIGLYPVYGGNGLRGYYSEYNSVGDYLLVGRQGALCGNVHKVNGNFWATEHAILTSCSSRSYLNCLYYLLIGMNLNQYASNTAAQPGLSVEKIINIRTCLIPIEEQIEICKYLDAKTFEIDTLIAKKEQIITELENYKKSIIYEYVTGKKEIYNYG